MSGGFPLPLGFGFGPLPMPGAVDGDPGQMQLDDEQRRSIAARLLGAQMFHPGNGPVMSSPADDQDAGPYGGRAPAQASSAAGFDGPPVRAMGDIPSMLGGQIPAPQMPEPTRQDGPGPSRIPSLIGSILPQMPQPGAPQATGAIPRQAAPEQQQPATGDDDAAPAVAPGAPGAGAAPARAVPTPPMRPAELSLIGNAAPRPAGDFDPLTGQPVSGSPRPVGGAGEFDPLTGQPVSGSPQPIGPPGSGPGAGRKPEGPGFIQAWKGLADSGIGDQLIAFGSGLLSGGGAAGWAQAGQNMLGVSQRQGAGDAQRLEYNLKLQAAQQKQMGQNLTYQRLVAKGVDPADAQAAIGAAMAGHNEALSNLLNNNFRKVADAPSGYRQVEGGGLEAIPGGPQDLGVKRADAQASAAGSMEGGAKPLDRIEAEARAAAAGSAAGKPDDDYNLSPGQTRYSGETNQPVAVAAPDKPQNFDTETKLRTEFAKGLNTFGDVHDGYGRVIAATRQREANPGGVSPASDISLVFGYMKMLDPGSVVREGEYATAANAAGIPERVRNAYNKAMNGEFLTGEQRQDFLGQAAELYGTARKTAEGVAGRYRNLAGQYGVDPDRVAYLPDAPTAPTVGRDRMKPAGAQGGGQGGQSGQRQAPAAPSLSDLQAEARKRGLIR